MYKKFIYLVSFVFVLVMASNTLAELVGHWTFDEGSGDTAYDSSGNGHDGTLVGDPQWVAGAFGTALQFDGVDDYVDIGLGSGNYFSTLNSGLTVAAWINRASTGTYDIVFGSGRNPVGTTAGDNDNGWKFGLNSTDLLTFTTLGILDYTSSVGVPTGEWVHVAATFNNAGTEVKFYVNGSFQDAVSGNGPANPATGLFAVGFGATWVLEFFDGRIDDVQVYNNVISETELKKLAAVVKATKPSPADGALYPDTWVILGWSPGAYAVSHNVYLGDNFDNVNDGTGGTFQGNQTNADFIAGFFGYPFPDGLVPGTTYYWRIDEVNDADTNSPWRGDVWSFRIPPKKAYEPKPLDGVKFVDPDVTLTWTAGFGAKVHYMYFGDDFDTVTNATEGTRLVSTSYSPGALEREKTYYWRVDENDGFTTYKGDVWSFTTIPDIPIADPNLVGWWKLDEGYGATAIDWSGHGNSGTLQGDTQWVAGYEGGALEFDGAGDTVTFGIGPALNGTTDFSVTAWIKTSMTSAGVIIQQRNGGYNGEYRFMVNASGQLNLMLYGDSDYQYTFSTTKSVNDGNWHHVVAIRQGQNGYIYIDGNIEASESGTLRSLDSSIQVAVGADIRDSVSYFNGTIDDVRIYDKALTQDDIKQVMRIDPLRAWGPSPSNGSTPDIDEALPLTWSPGDKASQHDVYFGSDKDAVNNADISTTGIYQGRQGVASYTPPEGVEWGGGPYYWRIDEYNTDATISKGRVWSFTVADFIAIDDFEDYNAEENQIWYAWRDGLGFGAIGTPPYSAGNGTGSAVGDETTASYTEETIVNSGGQSMPYWYDNNKPDKMKYSEAKLTVTTARDWTEGGVKALSMWFRGYPASVGSFTESPAGTYTMTASGYDIWFNADNVEADEFHYAYKTLTGQGTIIARVDSVENTNGWAKAGVMIRNTLDPNSAHAFACITPSNGVAAQGRPSKGGASFNTNQTGITAPHWIRLERDLAGNFTVSHSANGTTWEPVTNATPQNIPMNASVYIGLALTAHNAAATCEAVFSNVTISGNVSGQWLHQDIGIQSNDLEPMYVAVANNTGTPAVVYHEDLNAAQIDTWTEWNIDLKEFADKGVVLTDVNSIAIGFGNRNNPQAGGSGKMYFDDIRLYRPRFIPGLGTPIAADFDNDGVVYNSDLEILSNNWLNAAAASSSSPVGWWKFENNANDSAGAHHGTANGSPVYTAGADGQAISLDGINDYVSVGSVGISGAAPRTISGWAKANATVMPDWTNVFGFTNDLTSGQAGRSFDIQHTGVTSTTYRGYGIHVYNWEQNMFHVDLEWHHLAATYDGTTIRWYGDGLLVGSEDRVLDTVDNVQMGKRGDNNNYFPGLVDDVRIYNYALSSSEIFYLAGGSPLDFNDDMKIDLKDYAAFAEQWLEEQLWPEW